MPGYVMDNAGNPPEGLSLFKRGNTCPIPDFLIPSIQKDLVSVHSAPGREKRI